MLFLCSEVNLTVTLWFISSHFPQHCSTWTLPHTTTPSLCLFGEVDLSPPAGSLIDRQPDITASPLGELFLGVADGAGAASWWRREGMNLSTGALNLKTERLKDIIDTCVGDCERNSSVSLRITSILDQSCRFVSTRERLQRSRFLKLSNKMHRF